MIKKILLLKLMALCFTSSLFCDLREIGYLKNIHNLPSIMEEKGFLASETAIIFDIDGTLVVENEPLFNQELCREQSDHLQELADVLCKNKKDIWEDISYFREKEEDCIRFVEDTISETIQSLQTQNTTIFTCTRSVFGYPHDLRINFMKKNNVDFSKPYIGEHFDSIPFFNPQTFGIKCHDFEKIKFRGHSSAYETKKSVIIDEIVNTLKNTKQIKNIIFIDNFMDEVEDVCDNCKSVDNIISLYYIRVREDTKIDELVASYRIFEQKYLNSPYDFDDCKQKPAFAEVTLLNKEYSSSFISFGSKDPIVFDPNSLTKKPSDIPRFIDFGASSSSSEDKPVLWSPKAINPAVMKNPFSFMSHDFGWNVNPDEVPARPSSNPLLDLAENYLYDSEDDFISEEDSEEGVTDTEDSESEKSE
ncbi:MAG: DUF2608 domain-containing protein [Alphaproteobacteria bacterium]|nr:DUF2608 domain-containing protein [Alphaproteobacteria bacterium]